MLDLLAQSSAELDAAAAGVLAGLGLFLFILFLVWVFFVICAWKALAKTGQPGWACLIPIYVNYVWVKAIHKPTSWFILSLIPLVNIVFGIMILHEISKGFGKGAGFTVGMIFLSPIFLPILAFGSAQWQLEPNP